MKAIHMREHGGPGVLKFEDVGDPGDPGPGEVRLRQSASGLNYLDVYFRRGEAGLAVPYVPGTEGAGTIEAVGKGVAAEYGLEAGDRAGYQLVPGSYAEARVMPAGRLVKLPEHVSDETAAATLLKGMTAEYLLRRTYAVGPEDTLLVHAASGGVGSLLTQWAKSLGARVIGTVGSEAKAERARSNGVDHPVLYQEEDFAERTLEITGGEGVSVVYDGVGKATFHKSLGVIRPEGLMVVFGWASGQPEPLDVHDLNSKSLAVASPSLGTYTGTREKLAASAEALFDVLGSGAVEAEIGQRYPLSEAAEAHRALEARETTASTVLLA